MRIGSAGFPPPDTESGLVAGRSRGAARSGNGDGDVAGARRSGPDAELTPQQQREVERLRQRDTEVRAHEAAHAAAAGAHGGGASFKTTTGPDGRTYATGGEVPVQLVHGRTPEETIQNAQQVRRAALAPAQPSSQDRAVAAQAAAMEAEARAEKAQGGSDGGRDAGSEAALVAGRLSGERRLAYGDRGHDHTGPTCGFCSRAASRYAS